MAELPNAERGMIMNDDNERGQLICQEGDGPILRISRQILSSPHMLCPVCGFECVHPIRVDVTSPGTKNGKVTVDNHGVHLDPTTQTTERGCIIDMWFACESGHRFTYRFQFHKGHTLVELRGRLDQDSDFDTIWRD